MNNLSILTRSQLDLKKWKQTISSYPHGFPYASSWYLDIVSPNWDALIVNDYEFVLPLPSRKKWGFNYVFPPEFTQQIGLIGKKTVSKSLLKEVIEYASSHYSYLELNLNDKNPLRFNQNRTDEKLRKNFELDLSFPYEELFSNFHKNTQRNIKKTQKENLSVKKGESLDNLIATFKENKAKELKNNLISYELLETLYNEGLKKDAVELVEVYSGESFLGGALFLTFNQRKVFLFSSLSEKGREQRAMFYLINETIKKHSGQDLLLDFEGSDNTSLGDFYRRFGAKEKLYLHLKINQLPFYLRWLKE